MTERTKLPMVCICDDGGKAEAAASRQRFLELMAEDSGAVLPETFLTSVVVSLNWDFDSSITMIANDMWSGVTVKRYTDGNEFRCDCDLVEDGLISIWLHLYDEKKATSA